MPDVAAAGEKQLGFRGGDCRFGVLLLLVIHWLDPNGTAKLKEMNLKNEASQLTQSPSPGHRRLAG
jgi:hypothetical protein